MKENNFENREGLEACHLQIFQNWFAKHFSKRFLVLYFFVFLYFHVTYYVQCKHTNSERFFFGSPTTVWAGEPRSGRLTEIDQGGRVHPNV